MHATTDHPLFSAVTHFVAFRVKALKDALSRSFRSRTHALAVAGAAAVPIGTLRTLDIFCSRIYRHQQDSAARDVQIKTTVLAQSIDTFSQTMRRRWVRLLTPIYRIALVRRANAC